MSQTVEIIKAVAELLNPIWWPITIFASVWITRHQLQALIKGIIKLEIGHKDTKLSVEIEQELDDAAKAVPINEQQIQALMERVDGPPKATLTAEKEEAMLLQAFLGALHENLRSLETLARIAEKAPRAAIEESWKILKQSVVGTARVTGFKPSEEGDRVLNQAVHYLSLNVLKSQDVMISVYALAAALQKVERNQDAVVSAKDGLDFVKNCMAILADLLVTVRKRIP